MGGTCALTPTEDPVRFSEGIGVTRVWVREGTEEGSMCSGMEALQEKSLGCSESAGLGLSSQELLCKARASRDNSMPSQTFLSL